MGSFFLNHTIGRESLQAVAALLLLALFLEILLHLVRSRTVRVYNWNGSRYCYLGRTAIRRNGGGYLVCLRERMADLSCTTLYRLCPSRGFVRRNRYADMELRAGRARSLLHVDDRMEQSVYYRQAKENIW